MLHGLFKHAIDNPNTNITTRPYRCRSAHTNAFVNIKTVIYCLKNPCSNIIEYIAATNQIVPNINKILHSVPAFDRFPISPNMTPSPEELSNNEIKNSQSIQSTKYCDNTFHKNNHVSSLNLSPCSQDSLTEMQLTDKSMENFKLGSVHFPVDSQSSNYKPHTSLSKNQGNQNKLIKFRGASRQI
jgi:hypothetical protein